MNWRWHMYDTVRGSAGWRTGRDRIHVPQAVPAVIRLRICVPFSRTEAGKSTSADLAGTNEPILPRATWPFALVPLKNSTGHAIPTHAYQQSEAKGRFFVEYFADRPVWTRTAPAPA